MSFTKLKFTLFKIILTRKAPNFQWNKHHFIFTFYMLYAVAITLSLNWCISVCRGPFFSLISKVQESFAVCGKYSIVFTKWQCLHGILMWNIFYTLSIPNLTQPFQVYYYWWGHLSKLESSHLLLRVLLLESSMINDQRKLIFWLAFFRQLAYCKNRSDHLNYVPLKGQ